jgi:PRTRC genetic system protein C
MQRTFKFKGQILPDPGEEFTVEQVKELYAAQFPELASAATSEHEEGGVRVVEFVPRVGTKG